MVGWTDHGKKSRCEKKNSPRYLGILRNTIQGKTCLLQIFECVGHIHQAKATWITPAFFKHSLERESQMRLQRGHLIFEGVVIDVPSQRLPLFLACPLCGHAHDKAVVQGGPPSRCKQCGVCVPPSECNWRYRLCLKVSFHIIFKGKQTPARVCLFARIP